MNLIKLLLGIMLLVLSSNSFCQSWELSWESQLGNQKMDFFTDVIETKNQGYVVLGSTLTKGSSYDYWLIHYAVNGDTLWTKNLGTENRDVPKKVVQMSDGGFLLSGTTEQNNTKKLFLLRTDEQGKEQWRKIMDSEFYVSGEDVVALENNEFAIAGAKGSDIENANIWLARMDASGTLLWEKTFDNSLKGYIKSVKELPTGGFVLSGMVYENEKNDCDILIMRTDKQGESIWTNRIESPGSKEWPECVCCSPDSCFVLVGWKGKCMNDITSVDALFDYDMIVNKVDCDGKVLWTKDFDREGSEGGNAVVIRPDGNLLVAGIKATSFLGKVGPWLLHVDANGNELDEKLLQFHFNKDQAIKVINCTDGGFVVIGPGIQEDSNVRSDGWIMKFASL